MGKTKSHRFEEPPPKEISTFFNLMLTLSVKDSSCERNLSGKAFIPNWLLQLFSKSENWRIYAVNKFWFNKILMWAKERACFFKFFVTQILIPATYYFCYKDLFFYLMAKKEDSSEMRKPKMKNITHSR